MQGKDHLVYKGEEYSKFQLVTDATQAGKDNNIQRELSSLHERGELPNPRYDEAKKYRTHFTLYRANPREHLHGAKYPKFNMWLYYFDFNVSLQGLLASEDLILPPLDLATWNTSIPHFQRRLKISYRLDSTASKNIMFAIMNSSGALTVLSPNRLNRGCFQASIEWGPAFNIYVVISDHENKISCYQYDVSG